MNRATRILVVDDEPGILKLFSTILRRAGYEVWEASSGRQGLQVTRERRPDLVVLDVMLPDLSGIDVCRQIKADAALLDIFVVLVSGKAISAADKVSGAETGADDYIVKPVNPDEFRARIRTIMRLRNTTAALRASEQHYRRLVEILPDAVGLMDFQGRLTTANRQAVEMLGYAGPGELLGKSAFDLTPPEEHERVKADITTTLETGVMRNAEYTMLRKNGGRFPVELSAAVSTDVDGQSRGVVIVVRDITARRQAEEALRQSQERYRTLAESSPDAIFILDRESIFQYVNRAAAQWLGRPATELLGRSQAEFFPPDTTRQQQEALQRVFQTGEMLQTERSRPFQGGEKWVETRLVPLRDQAGKVSFVMGISRDLTERKRADLQLATLAHAVKSTTEMICITDLNDRFIFVNDAFQKVYGYSEAEILGKIPEILLSPKNPPLLMQEILEQSHLSGWRGEVINRRKDGTEFPIFLSTSQVKDHNGVVAGLMGVSQDITERKRAETILRENEARLRLLTEQVPAIIWTTDRDLKFTSSTGSPLAALSLKNNEMVGLSLFQFFGTTDEDFPSIAAHRRALGGERSEREMEWGGRVWHSFIEPLVDNGGKTIGCIGVAVDVTEAKKIEARLQELAAIVQSSEDAIISMTTKGIIISWNNGAKRLLGYAAEEVIGKNISIIVPPEQFEKARGIIRKAAQGESVEMYEAVRRHKDGKTREVSIKVSPVTNVAGKVISMAAILRDITARKQLEKTVLEISADERRRIGHELHDGLGQYLTGIAFKTKVLEEDLAAESSRLTHDAETIVGLINEAIQQTRNLARGLDPVDFEVSGLPAALQNLAIQTEHVFHIDCIFRCDQEHLNLDAQTNVTLYRIAQEAINNAIKHGQARRIEIDLKANNPQLSLTIRDNGKGFLLDDKPRLGMGLHIMSYRADTLGGILSIHSEVDVGTEIKCLLPKVSP